MPKSGFKRDGKAIARILHNDPGAIAAQRAAAERVLAEIDDPDAFIVEYDTDRKVIGVVVPAERQAKDGTATRAASAAGLAPGR